MLVIGLEEHPAAADLMVAEVSKSARSPTFINASFSDGPGWRFDQMWCTNCN